MATYAISDIHGAYDEFRALLRKIEFHYDGSDQLYLLGDYCDWGGKSMETLQFVKNLDERYDFVHCVMGNHEAMFLSAISGGCDVDHMSPADANWLLVNRGLVTWQAYQKLPESEKSAMEIWLRRLRYSYDVNVNGVSYQLAHAYPYYYDQQYTPEEAARHKTDSVWRRLLLRENPFASYQGEKHYDIFICGHTISDVFYQQLRGEKNWPFRKPAQTVRNRIFRAEMFIDIDCGAKCMDMLDEGDVLQIAAMRAQLACLRLDDGMGIYVHRRIVRVDDTGAAEIVIPDVKLPEVRLPDVKLPDVKLPDVKMPDVDISGAGRRVMDALHAAGDIPASVRQAAKNIYTEKSGLKEEEIRFSEKKLPHFKIPVFEDPDPQEDFE